MVLTLDAAVFAELPALLQLTVLISDNSMPVMMCFIFIFNFFRVVFTLVDLLVSNQHAHNIAATRDAEG